MSRRRPRQQEFVWKTRGGRREGAGRKPRPENVGLQPHVARPAFDARIPLHITMRAVRSAPAMRTQVIGRIVTDEIARASKDGFRVIEHSIQKDHLHLVVEADSAKELSRGMQRLAARIARIVNMTVGRRGQLWRERYHRRDLGTPRQFRNAIVYVLFNFRKHATPEQRKARARVIDGFSSGPWFEGWASETFSKYMTEHRERAGPRPTAAPMTWIARVGWKRHGRIDPRAMPRLPG